jgi:NAD(P)H-hydrate repair Nnr-like enzyme with NAD(P)H-hydrate epimerase domain
MDADTGAPMPECVLAALTATMVAPKAGFAAPGAAARVGRLEIVGIGGPAPADHG